MRKIFAGIMVFFLLISATPGPAYAQAASSGSSSQTAAETQAPARNKKSDKVSTQDTAIYSRAACVMDAKTGQVLYYKNPEKRRYPASITKIMTALLMIENMNLKDKITFTDDCWNDIDRWSDMNVAMETGESLSVRQALYCILLVSANEVCNQAAIQIAGSADKFADMMNEKAKSLGCTRTHFVTTNGLHNKKHYTTAGDMALISRAAILNDTFRKITGTTYYKVKTDRRPEGFELYHKHRMIAATSYHDDRCIGGKTGYTPQANNTLVTYMESGGTTLVCVVLDNNNGHIYSDTKTLCDYVFKTYPREAIDKLAESPEGKQMNEAAFGADPSPAQDQTSSAASASEEKTSQGDKTSISLIQTPGSSSSASAGQDKGKAAMENIRSGLKEFTQSPSAFFSSLKDRAISAFIKHIPYSFAILLLVFLVLSLIIIWLRGVIHRSVHRRRYSKMRKKRSKKNQK